MRILFVHEVSYEDKIVFEMHEFPERLTKLGLDEIVFLDYDERPRDSWRPRLKTLDRLIQGRSDDGIDLRLISIERVLPGIADRLLLSLRALWLAPRILSKVTPDIVVTYAVPTFGWQFRRACTKRGIPLVYRAIDVSHQIRKSPFQRLVKWAEKHVLASSDLVIFNNDALAEYARELGASEARSAVVAPGFDPWPELATKEVEVQDFSYNVVFMGTLFEFCGLDWFLQLLAENRERYREIKLLIIGDGDMRLRLERLVESNALGAQVRMTGRVEYQDLNALLSKASVAIIPFDVQPVATLALPGKVPQYIRSGLATVSTNLRGLKSVLTEGNGVTYAAPGIEFLESILQLLDDDDRRQSIVEAGQRVLDSDLQWNHQLSRFRSLLEDLI